jgi:uncharacterized protein (DUF1778 family)
MGDWREQVSLRVKEDLRREIEEWASRERRSLGNFTQLMVDWAFEQLKIVGSMKRLLKFSERVEEFAKY